MRGLTFGKFMPMHRGHQLMIETSLAEVDDLTILVYDSNPPGSYTRMPLELRLGWLRALYPNVENILAVPDVWANEPGHDSYEYAQAYADQLSFLGPFDRVFTSEPGYERFARLLGAEHVLVDEARSLVPARGTEIREDIYQHRGFIDPLVYRSLIQKVVLVGTESTGKSTLAQALAERFDTKWVHEYGRELWTAQGGSGSFADHLKMGRVQYRREQAAALHSRYALFCDTNAWTTVQWSLRSYGTVDTRLAALARETAHEYLWFLCDNDIPWVQDELGMRELVDGEAERFQEQIMTNLVADGISYRVLSGPLEKRVERVEESLLPLWRGVAVA